MSSDLDFRRKLGYVDWQKSLLIICSLVTLAQCWVRSLALKNGLTLTVCDFTDLPYIVSRSAKSLGTST